jgi:hypothetical protein
MRRPTEIVTVPGTYDPQILCLVITRKKKRTQDAREMPTGEMLKLECLVAPAERRGATHRRGRRMGARSHHLIGRTLQNTKKQLIKQLILPTQLHLKVNEQITKFEKYNKLNIFKYLQHPGPDQKDPAEKCRGRRRHDPRPGQHRGRRCQALAHAASPRPVAGDPPQSSTLTEIIPFIINITYCTYVRPYCI